MTLTPPPRQDSIVVVKQPRSSNLELYRIICMLMIVAHHYVVNSGLMSEGGILTIDSSSANSIFLRIFGAWGKTGINCFLMITGYFMCTSQITLRKFIKLFAQILFYNIIIFSIFFHTGHEKLSISHIIPVIIPFWGFRDGFVSCFIAFYITIPFWNILIKNMTERQHQLLLLLLLTCYTFLGSLPTFGVSFNYITWFGVIYLMASYIRLYPHSLFERRRVWGVVSLISILFATASIVIMQRYFEAGYFFVSDSNKFFAVLVALSTFLWFKNLNIKYSKVINAFGAATFGVLLIHANSDAMRTWLWKDTVDVIGHYSLPLGNLVLFSVGVVLAVFLVCNLIDQLRIATIEKWFFNWYDRKVSVKADALVNKILKKY